MIRPGGRFEPCRSNDRCEWRRSALRVEPRLQDDGGRRSVDDAAALPAGRACFAQGPARLHGRQALVVELDRNLQERTERSRELPGVMCPRTALPGHRTAMTTDDGR